MHPPRLLYPLALLTLALLLALPPISRGQDAWNTYQDTDPRLRYAHGTWQTFPVAAALGGTLTGTADPGATLTAYFEGTAVQLVYSLGPEGRTFSAQVDDGPLSTVYSYGDRYSHGQTLAFSDLPAGVHVLTVTNGDGAIWIEAVQVRGVLLDGTTPAETPVLSPTPTVTGDGWITYQDTDQFLVYDGEWKTFAVSDANGGTLTASAQAGATLSAYFDGTAIEVIYSKGPEGGTFSGRIPGEWHDYRNSYWDTYSHGHVFRFGDLTPGLHLLTLINGDGAIWIEAIRVKGVLLSPKVLPKGDTSSGVVSAASAATTSYFYLRGDSRNLAMASTHTPDWFYDSLEWIGLTASSEPVIGVCFTAVLQGEDGIQFAEMSSGHDGYTSPWQSFWEDTTGPGPGIYPTCVTDGYNAPDNVWYSREAICAQACPGATRLVGFGDWPKTQDGDYVSTWKIGWYRSGTLDISDARLIYYGVTLPTPTPTPTPTITPTFTPTPPMECLAQPIPAVGVQVRDTRHGPWEFSSPNANVKTGIPYGSTVVVAYKAIDDATLWYYATSYILNGEEFPIEDSDGLEGDQHGNWILQRNILRLRKVEDLTQPYQALLLEDSEACRLLPWYGEPPDCYGGILNMDDTCSFTYNRHMAAAYAMAYAASPNPDAIPDASPGDETSTLFCTYNYGGAHTGCASPNRPIPPATPEPNVTYPTDCANFTSIAMWYGGLPMTVAWYCEDVVCPICDNPPCPPCEDSPCGKGGKSPSWAGAMDVTWQQPGYLKSLGGETHTSSYPDFYLKPPNGYTPPSLEEIQRIKDIWRSTGESGDVDGHHIAKGDIVYVREPGYQHMMIVVGWGPVLLSWEAVDQFDPSTLVDSYPLPSSPLHGQVVPYLIDHGLHGTTKQEDGSIPAPICSTCTKPRPYYVLYWERKVPGIYRTYALPGLWNTPRNVPNFVHIPDTLTVPVESIKRSPVSREQAVLP